MNPGQSAFVLMLKALARFVNGAMGWPNKVGVRIVTSSPNETLKHMKYYWQKRDPRDYDAAFRADAPDSDCPMFAAFSWAHSPVAQKLRSECNLNHYQDKYWDRNLGVQEWQLSVHHTHLMMTQRAVWSKANDKDAHCPLVVTIRSAFRSGARSRGAEGHRKRDERQMQRKDGKDKYGKGYGAKGKTFRGA